LAPHTGIAISEMRTKALLLTAAFSVAAISATAQVYSVNAVGYVNKTLPSGFSMVANPLNNGDNKISDVFGATPGNITVYKYDGAFSVNAYDPDFEEWDNGDQTVSPGEGFFVLNGGDENTVTFIGEVPQGSLTTPLPAGFSIVSSQVPQEGKLDADLGFPTDETLTVYQFAGGSYAVNGYDADFEEWDNGSPVVGVGEAFWVLRSTAGEWSRDFSVNE